MSPHPSHEKKHNKLVPCADTVWLWGCVLVQLTVETSPAVHETSISQNARFEGNKRVLTDGVCGRYALLLIPHHFCFFWRRFGCTTFTRWRNKSRNCRNSSHLSTNLSKSQHKQQQQQRSYSRNLLTALPAALFTTSHHKYLITREILLCSTSSII